MSRWVRVRVTLGAVIVTAPAPEQPGQPEQFLGLGCLCSTCGYCEMSRDVPDIRFRFLLAGYPAVFFYPVPAPVPAEMVPGTGYLYRIVLGR